MQGPSLIFDKSALQCLSFDEAIWLDNFYRCNITPLFFIETLADLEKQVAAGRTPDQVVGDISSKTPDWQSIANVHHMAVLWGELSGRTEVDFTMGRPALGGGQALMLNGQTGMLFQPSQEEEALRRWQNREFLDIERQIAKQWRRGLSGINPAEFYYLPFCCVFASGDRLHSNLAPLFMRPFQTFITADELKQDPLRIVFVCAMWITGFDVPSCSTMYLDKPMKNHTLMQTIARANRVWKEKQNGLIVDYVGIFRDLQKALAIYGTTQTGGEMPIKDKEELVRLLNETIQKAVVFSQQHGVELNKIMEAIGFERDKLKDDAVAAFVEKDDTRRQFLNLVGDVEKLFKSLLPDPAANQFGAIRKMLVVIAEKIQSEIGTADITSVLEQVEDVLDASIATEGYLLFQFAYAVASFVANLSPHQINRRMRHNGFRGCIFNSTAGRRKFLSVLIAGYLCADCEARLCEWGVSDRSLGAIGNRKQAKPV